MLWSESVIYRCHHCSRPVSYLKPFCVVCRRFTWRMPHIILLIVLVLILGGALLWVIDYLATVPASDNRL